MKKEVNSFLLYFTGEFISKGMPFLLIPYLTRKLGPTGYGELTLALTIIAVVSTFVSLGQEAATVSYYYRKGKNALPYLIVSSLTIILIMSLFITLSLYGFSFKYWLIIATIPMPAIIINYYMAILQAENKPGQYIIIQILTSLLSILFTVLFIQFLQIDKVKLRLEAISLSNVIILPFIIYLLIKRLNISLGKKRLILYTNYVLNFGLPTFFHSAALLLKGQTDRILIYDKYTPADLGVYSVGVQIASVFSILIMIVNKSLVPRYYELIRKKVLTEDKIIRLVLYSIPISSLLALLAYLAPTSLYHMFLGDGYDDSKYFTVLYSLGYGLTIPYLLLVNYFFYYGLTKTISKVTVSTTALYILLLYVFSQYSIRLIPYSFIMSNIVLILIFLYLIRERKYLLTNPE